MMGNIGEEETQREIELEPIRSPRTVPAAPEKVPVPAEPKKVPA